MRSTPPPVTVQAPILLPPGRKSCPLPIGVSKPPSSNGAVCGSVPETSVRATPAEVLRAGVSKPAFSSAVAPAGTAPAMAPTDTIATVTAATTTPRQRTTAPIENTGFTYSQEWTDDLTDRSATPLRKTHRTRTVAQWTLRILV